MFNVRYNLGKPSRRYKKIRDASSRNDIMRAASYVLVKKTAGWITRRSATRHKTAKRLGIEPTRILEFYETSPISMSKAGGKIYARNVGGGNFSMFISGVPFIQKAFRDLHVTPKRARYLTIPLSGYSARIPARDMKARGWKTFRPNGHDVIMGYREKGEKPIPLYALKKSVRIPRDARLLPPAHLMDTWTRNAIKEELQK